MSQAAVVYWSGTGHTEAMAQAVAAAAQADLFTAAEFDADKAAHYAAIAFGCPSMGAEQLEESESTTNGQMATKTSTKKLLVGEERVFFYCWFQHLLLRFSNGLFPL